MPTKDFSPQRAKYIELFAAVLVLLVSCSNIPPVTSTVPGVNGKIAFRSSENYGKWQIYVMNADGSGRVRLTNDDYYDFYPAWSPDGSKIAFVSDRDGGIHQIYVMNADGSGQTRLTWEGAWDETPSWSPSGERIVFAGVRNGKWQLCVMNADGSDQRILTKSDTHDGFPDWSPDGTKIVFHRELTYGNQEIYVMNADGSNLKRLTYNEFDDAQPFWSPDGSRIVFRSSRDGNWEIYVMNADGSGQTRLTFNSAWDETAVWSPDGEKILFASDLDNGGRQQIYVMNFDGSGQKRLTFNGAVDQQVSWQSLPESSNLINHTIKFVFDKLAKPSETESSTDTRDLAVAFSGVEFLDEAQNVLLRIDVGTEKDRKYLGAGWYGDEFNTDGFHWAWTGADGKVATILCPLPPGSTHLRLYINPYLDNNTMSISLDGKEVGRLAEPRGWADYLVPLNPEGGVENMSLWEEILYPGGKIEQGPPLMISSSANDTGSGGRFQTRYPFIGDFDVQADFRIGAGWWDPVVPDSGYIDAADMGLYIDEPSAQIMYYISSAHHTLGVTADKFTTIGENWIESNNVTSGSFRIIRTGSDVAFLVNVGSGWQKLSTVLGILQPVRVYISCGSDWATKHAFYTYFENIKINTGNVASPYTLTFNQDGVDPSYTGTVVTIDGVHYKISSLPQRVDASSNHVFSWHSPLQFQTHSRYVWMYSSGVPEIDGTTAASDENTTITAYYKTQYGVEIKATPGGQVSPSGSTWYDKNAPLTITATPDQGFKFIEWRIDTQIVDTKSQSVYIPILTSGGVFTAVFSDETPPIIQQFGLFNPGDISWSSETKISATYSDNHQVDPASIKLKIDGADVTSGVSASPYSLWYRTNLSPGSHTIELTLSDMAGNINSRSESILVLPLEFGLIILAAILPIGLVLTLRKHASSQPAL